jgi:hypothetical protein
VKVPFLDRLVVGVAVAVPATLIVTGGAFAYGLSGVLSAVIGAGAGAVCGLIVQRHLVEVESQ